MADEIKVGLKFQVPGVQDIKDLAAVMPRDLQRAHRVASKSAAAAGYREGAKALAAAAPGTNPRVWQKAHRIYTSVDAGTNDARVWMGLNPYPPGLNYRSGWRDRDDLEEFPDGFDPTEQVGEVMAGAYLRVLDSQVQKIIDGA